MQVPLERYYPEYTGGSDINKAAKYILWRFMQANRARLSVYPQYVYFLPHLIVLRFLPSEIHQSYTSNRYNKYPSGIRPCQGDNTSERTKGFRDPIACSCFVSVPFVQLCVVMGEVLYQLFFWLIW